MRKPIVRLLGDESNFDFDHRFINALTLGIAITSLIGFIINVFLSLGTIEIFLTLINAVVYFLIYGLSRILRKVTLSKWIALLFAFIVLSVLWINSAGSSGPIPYTYFLLVLCIVLLTESWSRAVLLILLALDLVFLFYYEHTFPERMVLYENPEDRWVDLLTSIILYIGLATIIMGHAKSSYIREKMNALKADKLKTAFLANMSHEIRTPMNAIMGFTSLLKNRALSDEKREKYYKTVDESVNYLLRLIDDILDISQIEADEMTILPRNINLDELLVHIELIHQPLIKSENKEVLRLYFENAGNDTVIETDTTRLEQILSNLISNAVKFTEKGYIRFGYREEKRNVLFYVEDTGIGIEEKDKESVFDRFVKLDSTNYEILHRGTGIGLSISKKIVELLGGKIWFESKPNQGTLFYFTLPYEVGPNVRREII